MPYFGDGLLIPDVSNNFIVEIDLDEEDVTKDYTEFVDDDYLLEGTIFELNSGNPIEAGI